jgi:hypothetical protein
MIVNLKMNQRKNVVRATEVFGRLSTWKANPDELKKEVKEGWEL